jgi:hypothetical protein
MGVRARRLTMRYCGRALSVEYLNSAPQSFALYGHAVMPQVEALGRDDGWDRDLFMIELDGINELPENLRFRSRYFACLLAWDASKASENEIRAVGQKLIDQGAAYFCFWGSDCERVHDLIDGVIGVRDQTNPEDQSVIMTSWHHDEPLSKAIWFVLRCALPDDPYIDDCKATIAISIGFRMGD